MADTFMRALSERRSAQGLDLLPGAAQDILLVVSELVTNSIRHTAGPCLLSLRADDDTVRISVHDSSRALPEFFAPDPTRIGRHGWEIINQLCSRVRITPDPDGKLIEVWLPISP
ncbi:ATP-binding protein [Streptomyces sp. H39-S7]|uniref:ATP-binding protein n=1 Tax=Streptomyces sp. H39-S7 TaxID=3004357 RepID=UPI0022AF644E|nr:ATP-binding protein [Streptomyces sp. H39-S7]MCZ4119935.1 ATP-binding protein [Streptomyces sp. H39-S7]